MLRNADVSCACTRGRCYAMLTSPKYEKFHVFFYTFLVKLTVSPQRNAKFCLGAMALPHKIDALKNHDCWCQFLSSCFGVLTSVPSLSFLTRNGLDGRVFSYVSLSSSSGAVKRTGGKTSQTLKSTTIKKMAVPFG